MKSPKTADKVKQMGVKVKKIVNDARQNREAEYTQIIYSGFDDYLMDRLLPGYTKPSIAIDDESSSQVHNCHQPKYFCDL